MFDCAWHLHDTFAMKSKTNNRSKWPRINIAKHRSGQVSYQVDLGIVDGKRKRVNFATKIEAQTFQEQSRIARANEGMTAFALPQQIRLDAAKAHDILAPHNVSILEAAKYYEKHVLAFKTAPILKEIVKHYVADARNMNLRPRTIRDVENRLNTFAADFGASRLSDITLEQLCKWIQDGQWEPRTRINYLTKLSQLYGYAIKHKWADSNLTKQIARPSVDESSPEIFTVEQAKALLTYADEYGWLPYIAIGLFAGVRSAEMLRLNSKYINIEEKTITIGADVAKKRSQRIIDMQPALLAWLQPCADKFKTGVPIIDLKAFHQNKSRFLKAAQIAKWSENGLRHSFASFHYAMFRDANETASQMGNSADIVHRHYKSLVSRSEAEKFWNLRPAPSNTASQSNLHAST